MGVARRGPCKESQVGSGEFLGYGGKVKLHVWKSWRAAHAYAHAQVRVEVVKSQ